MPLREYLENAGKIVAIILAIIVLIQILFVLNKDCKNLNVQSGEFSIDKCITGLVFLIIPTEVSIVGIFSPFPIILLIVLLLYWKYVAPNEK